jgi:transcriptional regulator with XRE-family HTH domain
MTKIIKGLDIKIMRIRAGFRQYELAARLGIPPSRLSEIESGRRKPSDELVKRILKVIEDNHDDQTRKNR